MIVRVIAALLLAASASSCASPRDDDLRPVVVGRPAMGTILEITLVGGDPQRARADIEDAFAQVEQLESIISNHRPASAVSALNEAAGDSFVAMPPELDELIARSVAFEKATLGSFDVTVGPLVELWKRAALRGRIPVDGELVRARSLVGVAGIVRRPGAVRLRSRGMSIDFGGIAKGWALDHVVESLAQDGTRPALLNFGRSSVRAVGAPPGASAWRMVLPAANPSGDSLVLDLRDQALSVSSSLGQWSEIEGNRYGHVIDPRTGRALHSLRRAIVIAPTATAAEAFSTAFVILDPNEALEIANLHAGVEALIEDETGVVSRTAGLPIADRRAAAEERGL